MEPQAQTNFAPPFLLHPRHCLPVHTFPTPSAPGCHTRPRQGIDVGHQALQVPALDLVHRGQDLGAGCAGSAAKYKDLEYQRKYEGVQVKL